MANERSKNREQPSAMQPQQQGRVMRRERGSSLSPLGMLTPFSMMRRFADEMDRMFEGFGIPGLDRLGSGLSIERFSPEVDIIERDGKVVIRADLPGMTNNDVNVEINDDVVIIEGERKSEHEENEGGVYRVERTHGRFRREIPLPEGAQADTANAVFRNGVLEVTIAAPEVSKNRRRLSIQTDESGQTPGKSAA